MKLRAEDFVKPLPFEWEGEVVVPDWYETLVLLELDGKQFYGKMQVNERLMTPEVRALWFELQHLLVELAEEVSR